MKFSYAWLKDFVDIRIGPEELADRLTMAGIEVSSVQRQGQDAIFEAEITSNRPDWLSIRGIAREVAAITGQRFKESPVPAPRIAGTNRHAVRISIGQKKDCPLYAALVIDGVSIGPSPAWLRQRLESVGCRSVNAVVDITNYILFEYGQPLHAFDKNSLEGSGIVVRRGRTGETVTGIDGVKHSLDEEMLVISDHRRPVALAGVMGAQSTEVSGQTRAVLLEAAVFNPVLVRTTRQRAGISSESSYRFERGVDASSLYKARDAAAAMIVRLAGGAVAAGCVAGSVSRRVRTIVFSTQFIGESLGVSIPYARVKRILSDLGFRCQGVSSAVKLGVPVRRSDVVSPQDVVEEIARIYGYGRIPASFPAVKPVLGGLTGYDQVSFVKDLLVASGLHEAITYSLTSQAALDSLPGAVQCTARVKLRSPLSSEHAVLRPTLLPGLISAAAYNFNQGRDYVGLFEVAAVFCKQGRHIKEELTLGVVLGGERSLLLECGAVVDHAGFLHLKGIIDLVALRLGAQGVAYEKQDNSGGYAVVLGRSAIGRLVCIPEQVCAAYALKNKRLFCAEVSVQALLNAMNEKRRFRPVPRYPGITRDISCVLSDTDSIQQVLSACSQHAGALLRDIRIIDYYKGSQIPAGKRAVTIRCVYRADERTLKESEIDPIHTGLCDLLKERFGAALR